MKRIRITLSVIFVVLALTLFQAGTSTAYQLGWTSIQHRVYESGDTINRLAFEVLDDQGEYVDTASVVTGVILRPPMPNGDPDPSGSPVNLTTINFSPTPGFYGARFNTINSTWEYNPPQDLTEFNANILDPMVIGTYTLEVTTDTGPPLIGQIDFDFLLDLPIILSRTFQIQTDPSGNLFWTWDIPEQLLTLAETYDLQYRAGIGAMLNGQNVALYWPNVPVEMGFSFTPSSIFQELVNMSDEIRFWFQVRTSNNNARAYSKTIVVQDVSSPISVTPRTGRDEIIGTWDNGIWYWDMTTSIWTQMTSYVTDRAIASGDFTGDGKADVASIWDEGLYYQDGDTGAWILIDSLPPNNVAACDVTGDGRAGIIGTWSNGLWYWDSATSDWTQIDGSPPFSVTCGDVTGD
ncbi:MAG: hypothetical protein ACQ9MH_21520 [Nitrospinales bacterium]